MTDPEGVSQDQIPNKFHLAFAFAIVKLKPPEKQLKEHILEIRKFIRNDMKAISPERFFDSVAFWQSAYKDSEAEQTKLLNRIFELEQRSEGLNCKLRQSQIDMSPGFISTKRKPTGTTESLKDSVRLSKRAQQVDFNTIQTKESDKNGDSECLENENGPKLMRQIYNVQRAIRKKQNYKAITIGAVCLCKIARTEILEAIIYLNSSENPPKPQIIQKSKKRDMASVVKAVELSFNLAIQAIHRVIGSKDERGHKGQILYYVVCLFEAVMVGLAQHCAAVSRESGSTGTVLQETSNTNKPRTQKPRKAASRKPTLPPKAKKASMQNKDAQQLIDLLTKMALSLDLSRSVDEEVMEGFLFIAIDRVGKILALFTFENHQLPSEVCPDLHLPEGLIAMKEEAMTPQAVQLEAKYLIAFLDRLLNHGVSDTETIQTEFIQKKKECFQKTLVQAVFGTTDPLFHPGLTRPATPPSLSSAGRAPGRQEFSEWFTEELWRLVGWDVLNSVTQPL
ncbi:hypothetical protein N7478_004858 [Penicillium angulare]|uniref:uncharacterized protein n=1 Tax=Penicillium angulare TaxID=116970 RepID=UPI00253F6B26|nr:uncharacterized protein N7478_004858 [Penicillium angulare]KAJ5279486.1 hypothetical protein N7478_004858 [Penicillium angulare]